MRKDTPDDMILPAFGIGIMSSLLDHAGIDSRPAFEVCGLAANAPMPVSGVVTALQELSFERAFVALTQGRRALWSEAGRRHPVAAYGLFGMALITAPTLRHFAKLAGRSKDFCFSYSDFIPLESRGKLRGIEISRDMVPEDLHEFTLFRDLGAMSTTLQHLCWGRTLQMDLELPVPAKIGSILTDVIDTRLHFDCTGTRWLWDEDISDNPLFYGNVSLHDYYVRQCETAFSETEDRDLISRISKLIEKRPRSMARLAAVADAVNMSERTLQRRLESMDVSFRDVLCRVQERLAKHNLDDPSLSIAEVAARLGYADRSGFDLAFRRWTGQSPHGYRDRRNNLSCNASRAAVLARSWIIN